MQRKSILWLLAMANVVLGAALLFKAVPENTASAQVGNRRGDYLLIPGRISGNANTVIYVIDTANARLAAFIYDDTRGQTDNMAPIELGRIFEGGGRAPK